MTEERKLVSPFTDYVGVEIISMQDGVSELVLPLRPELLNSGGMAHGGVLATLADSAAGAAAFSLVEADRMAVTTDFNLACLKASRTGALRARGEIVHAGSRMMRAEVTIWCDDTNNTVVARAGVSFMVIDRPTG